MYKDTICSFENLYMAYKKAKAGKKFNGSTARFEMMSLEGVHLLKEQLENQTYKMAPYNEFKIYEPKERVIQSCSFKDKVVQHCLCDNVLHPILANQFIECNYAGQMGKVRAFLIKYYGNGIGQDVKEPLDTIPTHDKFGLVTIQGVDYRIVDIGLRMLEPKELYGCQGFPDDYIIDRDYTGKPYGRTEQVKRCGNAVCPPLPAALVRANLPELCVAQRTGNMRIKEEQTGQLRFA